MDADFCLLHYKMFKDAAGKTLKSILVSCNTRMEPFAIPQVRELVSFDEMELDLLGDTGERRAVFAVMSDTSSLYSFLFAIMMWQTMNILCKRAIKLYGGALPTPVVMLMDEFANIGRLPDVEKMVAVVRSRNISMAFRAPIPLPAQERLQGRRGHDHRLLRHDAVFGRQVHRHREGDSRVHRQGDRRHDHLEREPGQSASSTRTGTPSSAISCARRCGELPRDTPSCS